MRSQRRHGRGGAVPPAYLASLPLVFTPLADICLNEQRSLAMAMAESIAMWARWLEDGVVIIPRKCGWGRAADNRNLLWFWFRNQEYPLLVSMHIGEGEDWMISGVTLHDCGQVKRLDHDALYDIYQTFPWDQ